MFTAWPSRHDFGSSWSPSMGPYDCSRSGLKLIVRSHTASNQKRMGTPVELASTSLLCPIRWSLPPSPHASSTGFRPGEGELWSSAFELWDNKKKERSTQISIWIQWSSSTWASQGREEQRVCSANKQPEASFLCPGTHMEPGQSCWWQKQFLLSKGKKTDQEGKPREREQKKEREKERGRESELRET